MTKCMTTLAWATLTFTGITIAQEAPDDWAFERQIVELGATGDTLWRARLSDVPSASPISYAVDGKQYVAMVVGYGTAHAITFPMLTPEIDLPIVRSSTIWVFALPE